MKNIKNNIFQHNCVYTFVCLLKISVCSKYIIIESIASKWQWRILWVYFLFRTECFICKKRKWTRVLKRVTTTSPPYALLDKGASIWGLWE